MRHGLFAEVFESLSRLEASLDSDSEVEDSTPVEVVDDLPSKPVQTSNQEYYQFTYFES